MGTFQRAIFGCSLLLLAGCVNMDRLRPPISAEPLDVKLDDLKKPPHDVTRKDYLGALVFESEQKCQRFLDRLTQSLQEVNSVGDIATTVFSSLATVFTPTNTVHGLTAASTISSGTKSALLSDIYGKASISNFQTAIQQTYSTGILKYVDALQNLDENRILLSAEVSKIQSIHALCGIAQAEATITATLSPGAPAASAITVQKSFSPPSVKAGSVSTLTITLGNSSGSSAVLTSAMVDSFPAGLLVAPSPKLGGTCKSELVVAKPNASNISYANGAAIPSGNCTITVDVTAQSAGEFVNKIPANGIQTTQGANASEASAKLTITAGTATAPAPLPAPAPPSSSPSVPPARETSPVPTQGAIWGQRIR